MGKYGEKNIHSLKIPVFGMVKDEHHKTRTLVTDCEEISIAKEQSVFVFVYKIQEEDLIMALVLKLNTNEYAEHQMTFRDVFESNKYYFSCILRLRFYETGNKKTRTLLCPCFFW